MKNGILAQLLALLLAGPTLLCASENEPAVTIPDGMTLVPSGIYKPLFRTELDPKEIPVKSIYLDTYPVTNGEFLDFVRQNPQWRRSQVKALFADTNYLSHWKGDLEPGLAAEQLSKVPVTRVSWFAARAYAAWKGKRLPSTAEWEFAANASAIRPDGENDPLFRKELLRWFSTTTPAVTPEIGKGAPNFYGLHDMHFLVFEWVADFNNFIVTGESRGDTSLDRNLFCGSGSQGVKDVSNYPAFMRYAFRSSLQARYTVHNLGFRCAKDL